MGWWQNLQQDIGGQAQDDGGGSDTPPNLNWGAIGTVFNQAAQYVDNQPSNTGSWFGNIQQSYQQIEQQQPQYNQPDNLNWPDEQQAQPQYNNPFQGFSSAAEGAVIPARNVDDGAQYNLPNNTNDNDYFGNIYRAIRTPAEQNAYENNRQGKMPWDVVAEGIGNVAEGFLGGLGQAVRPVGGVVDTVADSKVPVASQYAQGVRGFYENVDEPIFNFTSSIVGDIARGQGLNFINNLNPFNAADRDKTVAAKLGYVQDAYNNAVASGLTEEQAQQVAQNLDRKLGNFANLTEYAGIQKFGTLPALAQLGIGLLDPVGNLGGEALLAGKLPRGLVEGGISRIPLGEARTVGDVARTAEKGLQYAAPFPMVGKALGGISDVTGLSGVFDRAGEALQTGKLQLANYDVASTTPIERLDNFVKASMDTTTPITGWEVIRQFLQDPASPIHYTKVGGTPEVVASIQKAFDALPPEKVGTDYVLTPDQQKIGQTKSEFGQDIQDIGPVNKPASTPYQFPAKPNVEPIPLVPDAQTIADNAALSKDFNENFNNEITPKTPLPEKYGGVTLPGKDAAVSEFFGSGRQIYGIDKGAIVKDIQKSTVGKPVLRELRPLEQMGPIGRVAQGLNDATNAVFARPFLNTFPRMIRDPLSNYSKLALTDPAGLVRYIASKFGIDDGVTSRFEQLTGNKLAPEVGAPSLAADVEKFGKGADNPVATLWYFMSNPQNEIPAAILRKVTKGKFTDPTTFINNSESKIKDFKYKRDFLRTYDNLVDESVRKGAFADMVGIEAGKITKAQLSDFLKGKMPLGADIGDYISKNYNPANLSDTVRALPKMADVLGGKAGPAGDAINMALNSFKSVLDEENATRATEKARQVKLADRIKLPEAKVKRLNEIDRIYAPLEDIVPNSTLWDKVETAFNKELDRVFVIQSVAAVSDPVVLQAHRDAFKAAIAYARRSGDLSAFRDGLEQAIKANEPTYAIKYGPSKEAAPQTRLPDATPKAAIPPKTPTARKAPVSVDVISPKNAVPEDIGGGFWEHTIPITSKGKPTGYEAVASSRSQDGVPSAGDRRWRIRDTSTGGFVTKATFKEGELESSVKDIIRGKQEPAPTRLPGATAQPKVTEVPTPLVPATGELKTAIANYGKLPNRSIPANKALRTVEGKGNPGDVVVRYTKEGADHYRPTQPNKIRPGETVVWPESEVPIGVQPKVPTATVDPAVIKQRMGQYYEQIFDLKTNRPTGDYSANEARVSVNRGNYAATKDTLMKADDNIRRVTGNRFQLDLDTLTPIGRKGTSYEGQYLTELAGKGKPQGRIEPILPPKLPAEVGSMQMPDMLKAVEQHYGKDAYKDFSTMEQAEFDAKVNELAESILGVKPIDPLAPMTKGLLEREEAGKLWESIKKDIENRYNEERVGRIQHQQAIGQAQLDQTAIANRLKSEQNRIVTQAHSAGYTGVKDTYFDYRNKNKVDALLGSVLPFQYWARQNFAFVVRHLAAHPMHYAALLNFYKQLEEENSDPNIPDYAKGDIFLWQNPDGSKVMWDFSSLFPFNPFGSSDSVMQVVSPGDDTGRTFSNTDPLAVLIGSDIRNAKGTVVGRNKGILSTFIRPNPVLELAFKTGNVNNFLADRGIARGSQTTLGQDYPDSTRAQKETSGFIPGNSFYQEIGAATGLTKTLRGTGAVKGDLSPQSVLDEALFGLNAGKPQTKILQELTSMAQRKEISSDQAKLAIAAYKEGNWTPEALKALDLVQGENAGRRLLTNMGFTSIVLNTPRQQLTNKLYEGLDKAYDGRPASTNIGPDGKKVYTPSEVSQYYAANPGASVLSAGNDSPQEIRGGIKDDLTRQAYSALIQKSQAKQISARNYNLELAKLEATNPQYFVDHPIKGDSPEQRKYYEQLDSYKAIGGDKYDNLSKRAFDLSSSGDKAAASKIYNSDEYRNARTARDVFMADNPGFKATYAAYLKSIGQEYKEPDPKEQKYFDGLAQYQHIGGDRYDTLAKKAYDLSQSGDKTGASLIYNSKEYRNAKTSRDQFMLDNPDFKTAYVAYLKSKGQDYKEPNPKEQQYFDELAAYQAIGGPKYDAKAKAVSDAYVSGNTKLGGQLYKEPEYLKYKSAREVYLDDHPEFKTQYEAYNKEKYGTPTSAEKAATTGSKTSSSVGTNTNSGVSSSYRPGTASTTRATAYVPYTQYKAQQAAVTKLPTANKAGSTVTPTQDKQTVAALTTKKPAGTVGRVANVPTATAEDLTTRGWEGKLFPSDFGREDTSVWKYSGEAVQDAQKLMAQDDSIVAVAVYSTDLKGYFVYTKSKDELTNSDISLINSQNKRIGLPPTTLTAKPKDVSSSSIKNTNTIANPNQSGYSNSVKPQAATKLPTAIGYIRSGGGGGSSKGKSRSTRLPGPQVSFSPGVNFKRPIRVT